METFDYKIPDDFKESEVRWNNFPVDKQTQWNQTLVSKISALSSLSKWAGLKRVVVPKQLESLIETLWYYKDGMIDKSFKVIITPYSKINCLLVEGEQLYIINYPYYYETATSIV